MKKHLLLLSAILLIQAAAVSAFAQDKPTAVPAEIDMSDFYPLGFSTVDEVLFAKFGLDLPWADEVTFTNESQHEYVDLGLSVKWAICNVGASKPEEYGDYYAWGETEPKEFYFWDTYKFCDGSYKTLTKYTDSECGKDGFSDNKSVLDPEDDVAHVKWGGNWRIPTKDELEELRTQCTWTSSTLNGVKGYTVTSKVDGYTDRSIFMPATGMRIRQWTLSTDTIGRFWGNSIEIDDDSNEAVYLDFSFSRGPGRFSIVRCFGQCVRPVCP